MIASRIEREKEHTNVNPADLPTGSEQLLQTNALLSEFKSLALTGSDNGVSQALTSKV